VDGGDRGVDGGDRGVRGGEGWPDDQLKNNQKTSFNLELTRCTTRIRKTKYLALSTFKSLGRPP